MKTFLDDESNFKTSAVLDVVGRPFAFKIQDMYKSQLVSHN